MFELLFKLVAILTRWQLGQGMSFLDKRTTICQKWVFQVRENLEWTINKYNVKLVVKWLILISMKLSTN